MSDSSPTCSRRLFLLGTATTFAGAFLAACGSTPPEEIAKADVPVGSAVILDSVIITQPNAGEYRAYSSSCPHQGRQVNKVDGSTVICTNHNSVFAIADGAVISGPARTGLAPAALTEEGDLLKAKLPSKSDQQ